MSDIDIDEIAWLTALLAERDARIAALTNDRDRLRAALEPFTKWKPSASWPDHEDQWNDVGLTVAHIRRARAAIAGEKEPT